MAKPPKPNPQSVAVLNKTNPNRLTPAQKSRVAQLLQNAATRHLLDDRFLSPAQRQARTQNAVLAAPVVEGSSVTNRDLAQQRSLAQQLRYGPQEQALNQDLATRQQQARDTAGWYDSYLAELRQHQANTQGINQQAVAQQQALTGAVGALQPSAGVAPIPGAVSSPQNAQDEQNATALRQALTASFGALMSQQGASSNQYADTLSHVVGPTQKLAGQAQAAGNVELARKALIQEAADKGLFGQQFESDFKQNEAKNVLAAQIAGVDAQAKQAQLENEAKKTQIAAKLANADVKSKSAASKVAETKAETDRRKARETARHNKAVEANQRAGAQSRRDAAAGKVNQYGYTDAAWRSMSVQERQRIIKDFKQSSGAGKSADPVTQSSREFERKYGVKPATTVQLNAAKTQIQKAQTWVDQVRKSNPGMSLAQIGQLLTRGQAKSKDSVAIPAQNPLFVRVAMDLAQYGGIKPGTADRLHRAGYSVKLLQIKNAVVAKPKTAGSIPGFGQAQPNL